MSFDSLARKEFDSLAETDQHTVIDFMKFLNQKNKGRDERESGSGVPYDAFSGGLHFIAEDFDDTPEGFEEYM